MQNQLSGIHHFIDDQRDRLRGTSAQHCRLAAPLHTGLLFKAQPSAQRVSRIVLAQMAKNPCACRILSHTHLVCSQRLNHLIRGKRHLFLGALHNQRLRRSARYWHTHDKARACIGRAFNLQAAFEARDAIVDHVHAHTPP